MYEFRCITFRNSDLQAQSALTINWLCPRDTCKCLWIDKILIKVMACRLLGAKPFPDPMMAYCDSDPSEQSLVDFIKL